MKTSSLRHQVKSSGSFEISCEIDGEKFSTVTKNTMAIDAAFDDCYDEKIGEDDERYYSSQDEAREVLVKEIIRKNS